MEPSDNNSTGPGGGSRVTASRGSTKNLHFDYDIPFFERREQSSGSQRSVALCAAQPGKSDKVLTVAPWFFTVSVAQINVNGKL
jgi:hypothetical protein